MTVAARAVVLFVPARIPASSDVLFIPAPAGVVTVRLAGAGFSLTAVAWIVVQRWLAKLPIIR